MALSFISSMKRYEKPRQEFEAYSLLEVIMRLKGEEPRYDMAFEAKEWKLEATRLKRELEVKTAEKEWIEKKLSATREELIRQFVRNNAAELSAAFKLYDATIARLQKTNPHPLQKAVARAYRVVEQYFIAFNRRTKLNIPCVSKNKLRQLVDEFTVG